MSGKAARARAKAKHEEKLRNAPYGGFNCLKCNHPDYAHFMWVGYCVHSQMKPKDGSTCECKKMR